MDVARVYRYKWRIVLLLSMLMFLAEPVSAGHFSDRYTKAHPLVYEDAWDKYPFSYIDDRGEPAGYNIELIKLLMGRMDVPYVVRLKQEDEVTHDILSGKADLRLNSFTHQKLNDVYFGKSVAALVSQSVMYPKRFPVNIHQMEDLRNYRVTVGSNSFVHYVLRSKRYTGDYHVSHKIIQDIQKMGARDSGIVLWNSLSLNWVKRQYHLDNMAVRTLDFEHAEFRFVSVHYLLIVEMDRELESIRNTSRLISLQKKWLGDAPTVTKQAESDIWWTDIVMVTAIIICMMMYWIYVYVRSWHECKIRNMGKRLTVLLQSGNTSIWVYDILEDSFRIMDEDRQRFVDYSTLDFLQQYEYADREVCRDAIIRLREKKVDHVSIELHGMLPEEKKRHYYHTTLSVLSRHEGKPTVLIATQEDFTDEREEQENARLLMLRYHTVFYHNALEMTCYDAEGFLTDLNDEACAAYGVKDKAAYLREMHKLSDFCSFMGISDKITEVVRLTAVFDVAIQVEHYGKPVDENNPHTIYYEMTLTPIYNKENQLTCIFLGGRNITKNVERYHRQKAGLKRLEEANRNMNEYTESINYALKESNIKMIKYSPATHNLKLRTNVNEKKVRVTQLRCMELLAPESQPIAAALIHKMDRKVKFTFDQTLKTLFRDKKNDRDVYLQFSGIPIFDTNGVVISYSGLCLDVSERESIQQKLKKETQKALETEKLKNAFLTNMSYEIRTPLNAVVGFAELFSQEHTRSDEQLFLDQIKTNSAVLLNLVNDILFLSRLDAHMVEFNKQPIDVVQTFEGHCQMGWADHLQEGVSTVVEVPYEYCIVEADDSNLGNAISILCQVMADNTPSGILFAKFECRRKELVITLENTGLGIPKELQPYIFDRFVKNEKEKQYGSGLSLPIIKELIEQMGGRIDLMSEEGKGTTVWITVPCQVISLNKKMEAQADAI